MGTHPTPQLGALTVGQVALHMQLGGPRVRGQRQANRGKGQRLGKARREGRNGRTTLGGLARGPAARVGGAPEGRGLSVGRGSRGAGLTPPRAWRPGPAADPEAAPVAQRRPGAGRLTIPRGRTASSVPRAGRSPRTAARPAMRRGHLSSLASRQQVQRSASSRSRPRPRPRPVRWVCAE